MEMHRITTSGWLSKRSCGLLSKVTLGLWAISVYLVHEESVALARESFGEKLTKVVEAQNGDLRDWDLRCWVRSFTICSPSLHICIFGSSVVLAASTKVEGSLPILALVSIPATSVSCLKERRHRIGRSEKERVSLKRIRRKRVKEKRMREMTDEVGGGVKKKIKDLGLEKDEGDDG
ncbi:hypothetical protein SADUNF_Sadunf08G0162000 [Salix dunnii]|uniref:Uncharacterized protein n=1 Tax=Salix dunnii TaxID=1413687 RepID=A0A835JZ27_9ROSI|nr:hypothetical protein SADUNF_Sadunf08G0162000 [Salix dunnii]